MVLVAFYAVRLSASGTRRDLVIAGITAGLATSTKYNAALVALPGLSAVLGCARPAKSWRARLADAAILLGLMTAAFSRYFTLIRCSITRISSPTEI